MKDLASATANAVSRARKLAPLLDASADRIEAAREMPADLLDSMHAARLFRVLLPKTLGGDELDLGAFVEFMEEVARGDASAGWVVGQGAGCAMAAAYLSEPAADRWFGPADAVLAWGAGIQGKAIQVDGGLSVRL